MNNILKGFGVFKANLVKYRTFYKAYFDLYQAMPSHQNFQTQHSHDAFFYFSRNEIEYIYYYCKHKFFVAILITAFFFIDMTELDNNLVNNLQMYILLT